MSYCEKHCLQLANHHRHANVSLVRETSKEFTLGPFPRGVVDHIKRRGTSLGHNFRAVPAQRMYQRKYDDSVCTCVTHKAKR